MSMEVMSLNDSNKFFISLIEKDEPFVISRVSDEVTKVSINFQEKSKITNFIKFKIKIMSTNAGIYCDSMENLILYTKIYNKCLEKSDGLACFKDLYVKEQLYYINKYQLKKLNYQILEPFYCCLEQIKPWTHYLSKKKILVINPFVASFQKQIQNKFKMFKDTSIFLKDQKFVFYKSFQCLKCHPHKNWFVTYNTMCNDIQKIDFDIAILGCGGYGLPLCHFIKNKMKKSAIYIGGGLQLLFGVMGKRWENTETWKKIIKENDCKFIRPSGDEVFQKQNNIEGGCYW